MSFNQDKCPHCNKKIKSTQYYAHLVKCSKAVLKGREAKLKSKRQQLNKRVNCPFCSTTHLTNEIIDHVKKIHPVELRQINKPDLFLNNLTTLNKKTSYSLKSNISKEIRQGEGQFAYYIPGTVAWSQISFQKRMLKTKSGYRFPIETATSEWTNYIEDMRAVDPRGLLCYYTPNSTTLKMFAITNLDIVFGVVLGILDPQNRSYKKVKITRVSEKAFNDILNSKLSATNKKAYLQFLNQIQTPEYPILKVDERVAHASGNIKARVTFIFSLRKRNSHKGLYVLESLDGNTATHLFKAYFSYNQDYYTGIAKLRNYFQSNLTNKREKLYKHSTFFQQFDLHHLAALHHENFDAWRSRMQSWRSALK